jgi:hypothetical protein
MNVQLMESLTSGSKSALCFKKPHLRGVEHEGLTAEM